VLSILVNYAREWSNDALQCACVAPLTTPDTTMHRITLALLILFPALAATQTPQQKTVPRTYVIRAAHLIDVKSDAVQNDVAVLVQDDRIVAVGRRSDVASRTPADAQVVDLGGATILPGLIDNHTHVLLQGDITAADYDDQLLKESIPYRAIRATAAVRNSLMNGFTTIR